MKNNWNFIYMAICYKTATITLLEQVVSPGVFNKDNIQMCYKDNCDIMRYPCCAYRANNYSMEVMPTVLENQHLNLVGLLFAIRSKGNLRFYSFLVWGIEGAVWSFNRKKLIWYERYLRPPELLSRLIPGPIALSRPKPWLVGTKRNITYCNYKSLK